MTIETSDLLAALRVKYDAYANLLRAREKVLVVQAKKQLLPVLEGLNNDYFGGKGKVEIVPLSERWPDVLFETPYNKNNPALIFLFLHKREDEELKRYAAAIRLWEPDGYGKQYVEVGIAGLPPRTDLWTTLIAGNRPENLLQNKDAVKLFDLSQPIGLEKLKNHVTTTVAKSTFFSRRLPTTEA